MTRRIFAVLLLVVLVGGFYLYRLQDPPEAGIHYYQRDEFERVDRDRWFVGEWQTMRSIPEAAVLTNDVLSLPVRETDRGPFLLSEPIPVGEEDVITIRRRVYVHYANDRFTGGFAVFETHEDTLRPVVHDNQNWSSAFGEGVVLVEYVHNYDESSERPGRDIFRVLPPTWEIDHNYAVIEPIFDKWFEEELIIDTRTQTILYRLDGKEYKVTGLPIEAPYLRLFTHAYGQRTGHDIKIDWIEIIVENKPLRK